MHRYFVRYVVCRYTVWIRFPIFRVRPVLSERDLMLGSRRKRPRKERPINIMYAAGPEARPEARPIAHWFAAFTGLSR